MIYIIILLPLVSLIVMKLLIHRGNIKNIISYCNIMIQKCIKHSKNDDEIPLNDRETPLLKEFGITVDDNMRRNAIIVEV